MDYQALSDAQAAGHVSAVKKFECQRAGGVLQQQMEDGALSASEAGQSAIGYRALNRVGVAGNDLGDIAEADAILVAEREMIEQVAYGRDAARGHGCGALRSNSFEKFDVGGEG